MFRLISQEDETGPYKKRSAGWWSVLWFAVLMTLMQFTLLIKPYMKGNRHLVLLGLNGLPIVFGIWWWAISLLKRPEISPDSYRNFKFASVAVFLVVIVSSLVWR